MSRGIKKVNPKRRHIAIENIKIFLESYDITHFLFLTLTFFPATRLWECRNIYKRFYNSVLARRYKGWVKCFEFGRNGNPHIHLLLLTDSEMVGLSFQNECNFLSKKIEQFGFGQKKSIEFLHYPERIAFYMTKNIHKKGCFVSSSKRGKNCNQRFSWTNGYSRELRRRASEIASEVELRHPDWDEEEIRISSIRRARNEIYMLITGKNNLGV